MSSSDVVEEMKESIHSDTLESLKPVMLRLCRKEPGLIVRLARCQPSSHSAAAPSTQAPTLHSASSQPPTADFIEIATMLVEEYSLEKLKSLALSLCEADPRLLYRLVREENSNDNVLNSRTMVEPPTASFSTSTSVAPPSQTLRHARKEVRRAERASTSDSEIEMGEYVQLHPLSILLPCFYRVTLF